MSAISFTPAKVQPFDGYVGLPEDVVLRLVGGELEVQRRLLRWGKMTGLQWFNCKCGLGQESVQDEL